MKVHSDTCRAVAEENAIENLLESQFHTTLAGATNDQYNEVYDYVQANGLVDQYLGDGTSTCYCPEEES